MTLENDLDKTETALKAVQLDTTQRIEALKAEIAALQATLPAPAVETHPDVWDSTGRLVSNDRNNLV